MKKRKLIFVLAFVIFVALGVVACIKILNVPREFHLTTIELPSGDRIIINYSYTNIFWAILVGDGTLKYDIYSGQSHSSGRFGPVYDTRAEIKITHEIQGERRAKIEDGRGYLRSWIFEGDSSGQYKVTELTRQPQGIE